MWRLARLDVAPEFAQAAPRWSVRVAGRRPAREGPGEPGQPIPAPPEHAAEPARPFCHGKAPRRLHGPGGGGHGATFGGEAFGLDGTRAQVYQHRWDVD